MYSAYRVYIQIYNYTNTQIYNYTNIKIYNSNIQLSVQIIEYEEARIGMTTGVRVASCNLSNREMAAD